jgi:hypothetical protein
MHATCRNKVHMSIYSCAEDKALLAQRKARRKELELAVVDY